MTLIDVSLVDDRSGVTLTRSKTFDPAQDRCVYVARHGEGRAKHVHACG